MLDRLESTPWATLPQPAWNTSNEVPTALRALATASTEQAARDAYDRLLYAIGNNHAGTYYPVVLLVIPFLGEILIDGAPIPREATLDVLVDLAGAFKPESGFEMFRQSADSPPLPEALRAEIVKLIPVVKTIQLAHQTTAKERALAQDFLSSIAEIE